MAQEFARAPAPFHLDDVPYIVKLDSPASVASLLFQVSTTTSTVDQEIHL